MRKVNLLISDVICHVLFSWMRWACLSEWVNLQMVPAVTHQQRQTFPWQQRSSLSLLRRCLLARLQEAPFGASYVSSCDPLLSWRSIGSAHDHSSKYKLKKIRPCSSEGKSDQFLLPRKKSLSPVTPQQHLDGAYYLCSAWDSDSACFSCSINDLERPHSLVLLLYLGWGTEHKEERHRLWGSELCTISEVEWTTEGDGLESSQVLNMCTSL